jgi:hypothetical protein
MLPYGNLWVQPNPDARIHSATPGAKAHFIDLKFISDLYFAEIITTQWS